MYLEQFDLGNDKATPPPIQFERSAYMEKSFGLAIITGKKKKLQTLNTDTLSRFNFPHLPGFVRSSWVPLSAQGLSKVYLRYRQKSQGMPNRDMPISTVLSLAPQGSGFSDPDTLEQRPAGERYVNLSPSAEHHAAVFHPVREACFLPYYSFSSRVDDYLDSGLANMGRWLRLPSTLEPLTLRLLPSRG
jgi:hypothetical protein